MKTRLLTILLLLCTVCAFALAEPRVYTYGGSGHDQMSGGAVSPDGRIVVTGLTTSTDGTLLSRTKSGHTGWALCVDAQGNVLWSFCSRLGSGDRMDAPVFHEDGSVTLVLVVGRSEGADAYELIRLDGQGEVLERRTMLEGGGVSSLYKVFATDAGYMLREDGPDGFTPLRYTLFDFHGEMVRQMDGWEDMPLPAELGRNAFFRIARRHTLRDEGERTVLTALDTQGNETLLAELQGTRGDGRTQTGWVDLISLDDGGAAVAGRAFDGRVRKGRIARWDAQGNPVFDWWLETGELMKLAQTNDGFVALMLPVFDLDAEMPERREWTLARFNDDGVQTGGVSLGEMDEFVSADMLALLPDGGVVVAYTDFDRDSAGDVCVIVVPAEDL